MKNSGHLVSPNISKNISCQDTPGRSNNKKKRFKFDNHKFIRLAYGIVGKEIFLFSINHDFNIKNPDFSMSALIIWLQSAFIFSLRVYADNNKSEML